jgi:hypothetical protein
MRQSPAPARELAQVMRFQTHRVRDWRQLVQLAEDASAWSTVQHLDERILLSAFI